MLLKILFQISRHDPTLASVPSCKLGHNQNKSAEKMEEAEKKYIHAVSILEQATDLEKHENVDIVFANGSETLPCIGMISDFSVLLSNLCIYDQFFFSSCFNI